MGRIVSLSPLSTIITNALLKASKTVIRDFGEVEHLQISRKGPRGFVSAADLKAEKTLHAELNKARPSYGFLMEEGGSIQGDDSSFRWIIDPIDGTTNFIHGVPHFALTVALEKEGEIIKSEGYNPYGVRNLDGKILSKHFSQLKVKLGDVLSCKKLSCFMPFS